MTRLGSTWFVAFLFASLAVAAFAAPAPVEQSTYTPVDEPDIYNDPTAPQAAKAFEDTIWIADWNFDAPGGGCTDAGWVKWDERVLNDGTNYWSVTTDYAGTGDGRITNAAAALRKHDLCWVSPDGYGNNWDYSIILKYKDPFATLSFKFIGDSEPGFDFVTIEADSLGLSESRVDYSIHPYLTPLQFRDHLWTEDGVNSTGVTITYLPLPSNGPGVHEVYIRFNSDGWVSSEDGESPSSIGAALVVDDIQITGGLAYFEDFEGALDPNVSFVNTSVATPFGNWARIYKHTTDNDVCTENTTCAWLQTDRNLPAFYPNMAFGPGGHVIHSWLDLTIVSPWASLATIPGAFGTVLSFRRFPGNFFNQGRIVQNWRVRGKVRIENTDTISLGDSLDCVSPWGHTSMFNALSTFAWVTSVFDPTAFLASDSREVQFSFRTTDWNYITGGFTPATYNPGPGPYLDRIRIGRRVLEPGPLFDIGLDTRFQAQDRFASAPLAVTPGEYFAPTGDRFGTCDFSQGEDKGFYTSSHVLAGDSVTTNVVDARMAGGITSVRWCGAIVDGPHAGKAPPPYAVGANGFFEVTADSSRNADGAVVVNRWFVDLDDTYFRGGDQLHYYWYATDAGGGASSAPRGITQAPANSHAAEVATGGLFEASFLPTIDWSPIYLTRIADDSHGDLEPTAQELAGSSQRHCILYSQRVNHNRRSGPTQRTTFMATLQALGYSGIYDIFDLQGFGQTNNYLATRASVAQCTGYQLIIEDDGRSAYAPNIPENKVRAQTFYRDWLDAGGMSEAGRATLWLMGESTALEGGLTSFITDTFGVAAVVQNQGLSVTPDVVGSTSFNFAGGFAANFVGDRFALAGGCQPFRNYDGFTPSASAVATHYYQTGATTGPAAVVMHARPATNSNTVLMGFGCFDIVDAFCVPPSCPNPSAPGRFLLWKVLSGALTGDCRQLDPTGGPEDDAAAVVPHVSALHPNVPNPFNPTTTIAFDLARAGHVRLEVFDVAGRRVRALVDGEMAPGFHHRVTWNGLDADGARVASGVYLYRLVAADFTATRKMIVLE